MRKTVEILILESEAEYREEYINVYVSGEHVLRDIPVHFSEKDFDHIFSEPDSEDKKIRTFSKRRAKKMHFMRGLLDKDFLKEILFEPDSGNIAVFSTDLDAVMYLRPIPGQGKLQVMTFFDFGRDHTRMYKKQRRKCIEITIAEIKEKI